MAAPVRLTSMATCLFESHFDVDLTSVILLTAQLFSNVAYGIYVLVLWPPRQLKDIRDRGDRVTDVDVGDVGRPVTSQ